LGLQKYCRVGIEQIVLEQKVLVKNTAKKHIYALNNENRQILKKYRWRKNHSRKESYIEKRGKTGIVEDESREQKLALFSTGKIKPKRLSVE
jgi:hypothetical protein